MANVTKGYIYIAYLTVRLAYKKVFVRVTFSTAIVLGLLAE